MKKFFLVISLISLCSVGYGVMDEEMYGDWMQQGVAQVKQGKLKDAKESFQNALIFKPNDAEAKKGIRMAEERLAKRRVQHAAESAAYRAKYEKQKDFSIRAAIGNAPGFDEFEVDGVTSSLDEEGGMRAEVLVVKRFWNSNNPDIGWSLGGGIFLAEHSGKDIVGDEVDLSAFGGMMQASFLKKSGDHLVWEFGGYLGVGASDADVTGLTANGGPYALVGFKGSVFYMLGNSFEIGLELGIESVVADVELTDGVTTADYSFSGAGPRVAAVACYKF